MWILFQHFRILLNPIASIAVLVGRGKPIGASGGWKSSPALVPLSNITRIALGYYEQELGGADRCFRWAEGKFRTCTKVCIWLSFRIFLNGICYITNTIGVKHRPMLQLGGRIVPAIVPKCIFLFNFSEYLRTGFGIPPQFWKKATVGLK